MTAPSTPEASAARPLGLAGALALALTVGFLGGMLFGLHEAAMTLARTEFAEDASSLSRILGLTGYAVFWNGVLGAVLSALVGACAWAAARSRRRPLSDALLLGILTAAMTLAFARTAIWEVIQEVPKAVITPAARSVASAEVWAMSALSAICIGYGVYRRCQRLGRPTRPLAFAFALFCGLAVWACWTVWVNAEGPRHCRPDSAGSGECLRRLAAGVHW